MTKRKNPGAPKNSGAPKNLEAPRRRINSRAKGASAERELAAVFRAAGFPGAVRGQQRSGLEQADVVGGPPGFHFEVKRVEQLRVWQAYSQAVRDAPGTVPVVATRRNGSRWLAVLSLDALLGLISAAIERDARAAEEWTP